MDNKIQTLRDLISNCELVHEINNIPLLSYWNTEKTSIINVEASSFKKSVEKFSAWLLNNNIENKNIAIISENNVECLFAFFAVSCSGNVAVMIDNNLNEDELWQLIEFNNCDVILYSNALNKKIENLNNKRKLLSINIIDKYQQMQDECVTFDMSKYEKKIINPDDNAVIIFTSGTSGKRKGVVLSHYNLVCNVYVTGTDVIDEGVAMLPLPFYHVFSLACAIIMLNRKYTLFIDNNVRYIVKNITTLKPTLLLCVPALLPYVYNGYSSIEEKGKHYVVCGGAGGAENWSKKFDEIGVNLLFGYGMSETTGPICLQAVASEKHQGYMDILDGGKIIINNPDEFDTGEVIYKGPSIMKGYYKMPSETNAVLKDGYLHTGDLGKIDEKGRLRIVGRADNIIVLPNGENIPPEAIEKKILSIRDIKECIVSSNEGQLQANIYAPGKDRDMIEKQIQSVNLQLNSHLKVNRIVFVDEEFVKNSSGKIVRNIWR